MSVVHQRARWGLVSKYKTRVSRKGTPSRCIGLTFTFKPYSYVTTSRVNERALHRFKKTKPKFKSKQSFINIKLIFLKEKPEVIKDDVIWGWSERPHIYLQSTHSLNPTVRTHRNSALEFVSVSVAIKAHLCYYTIITQYLYKTVKEVSLAVRHRDSL